MKKFPKPLLVVSKCLGFASCRWNGLTIASEAVEELKPFVTFHAVCPEVEIGLGIPREPVRVVLVKNRKCLIQPSTQRDVTDEMNSFTEEYLAALERVDGFILKSRSPSCGIKDVKIYTRADNNFVERKESGFFGGTVMDTFPFLPVEDEGRLTNFKIREHFLTQLFTIVHFKEIKQHASIKSLIDFQSRYKLLLMSYNQNEMRIMGKIVANLDKKPFTAVLSGYEEHLVKAFSKPPRYTSNINVLMHAFGYFSKELTKGEKALFFDYLEKYRAGNIPLSAALAVLRSWITRFNNEYLDQQTYFQPYPEELMHITDSGKGRDY